MNLSRHAGGLALTLSVLGLGAPETEAQGTLQYRVTFDGPPAFVSGDLVQEYRESGMTFAAILDDRGYGGFFRNRGRWADLPHNGTAYIRTMGISPLEVNSMSGLFFGLVSVDLAEHSRTVPNPVTMWFVGYRPDGSTVTTSFTTDGLIGTPGVPDFQTFYFGPEFNLLTRFEIPGVQASLDNFVFSQVPEPAAGVLLLVGGLLLGAWRSGWRSLRVR